VPQAKTVLLVQAELVEKRVLLDKEVPLAKMVPEVNKVRLGKEVIQVRKDQLDQMVQRV
jgi:hypothetical protein